MPSANRIQILRQKSFERQRGRCYYCSVRMWVTSPSELPKVPSVPAALSLKCTAEHLLARSKGGLDVANNIAAACWHCNWTRHRRKRPPEPDKYREEVVRRVRRGAWHASWVFAYGLLNVAELPRATLRNEGASKLERY